MANLNQLGRYQIDIPLGSGAYATVYRAVDTILKRPVALKILKPALLADDEALKRFFQEAQTLANLMHPHIAWVWDVGESESKHFIAMRYIDGRSLDKTLAERGRLPWTEALDIATQVAEALDFAHKRGLIHRDVKPQNIIVGVETGAALTDFGLVRALESSALTTHSGAIIGTPQYIAPEVWKGEESTPAVDQYALACVLTEMLTGETLFAGPTPPAVMMKHFAPLALPASFQTGTPAEIRLIIQRALAREPYDRYPTLREFTAALAEITAVHQRAIEQQTVAEVHAKLLATAEQQLAAQDWAGVLEIAGRLQISDPRDAEASSLQARVLQSLQTIALEIEPDRVSHLPLSSSATATPS